MHLKTARMALQTHINAFKAAHGQQPKYVFASDTIFGALAKAYAPNKSGIECIVFLDAFLLPTTCENQTTIFSPLPKNK